MNFDTVNNYRYTKDHSKVAITQNKKFVCVSDINRQKSQYQRGGTALCFENVPLWTGIRRTMVA